MPSDKRILVVEDDPQIAEIIQWNLSGAGFRVTVVQDGLEALVKFDAAPPALVTIDLNVPTVSGFRLVKLFKRLAPDLPIIVVSGLAFEEAEEIAKAGANDFITKPFDPQELVRKISFHLERSNSLPPVGPAAPVSELRRTPTLIEVG